ncbi:hypothetical protein QAD02_011264 [Eretmocerus hayati]|uniref:Uncharacterized protein n=1 Tax=Eretmocerus hayati TaxID=131215 RepID=A0ACC2NX94_9HYME|nr:hypothetical protein QAD02_011264 [Eretmocerus hayati]
MQSRLIVKNLPKSVTETRIKDLFGQKGDVTDVQLKYAPDGKFRRFGFVGFKSEEQAAAALEFFNNTCIDTCRISVDYCAALGDASKPKSWKLLEKHKDDPLFNEFMESHSKGDVNIWKNDTYMSEEDDGHSENEESDEDESDDSDKAIAKKNISDKEYMEALKKKTKGLKIDDISEAKIDYGPNKFYTVKIRGLAFNHKKKDIKLFLKGMKPKSIRVPRGIKGIAYVGFKTEKLMKLALNKNKSFLDGKRIFVSKYEEHNKNGEQENKGANFRWKNQEEALKNEESIAESGRIFLRNLAYTTTEDDVRKLFEKYGPLTEVNLPIDKTTRKPKGFGTITFLMPEHAAKAYAELDGTAQNGRMLHLLPAKTKTSPEDLLSQDGLNYKQKKELKDKATAGSSHNWNTLFLGHNAVADAIAKNYDTTKENVLRDDDHGTSVAVRLALGETQLVQETQKFLEESGVHLNAFNQPPKKRSKTVILVKNLPAGTQLEEIREMFSKHGELGRIVLPPSGISALVEFFEAFEARKAFTKLAYTKFKHLPLYLEWAPDDSFSSEAPKKPDLKDKVGSKSKTANGKANAEESKIEDKPVENEEKKEEDDDDDEDEPEPDTTLFVKNLNFTTTEEDLKKHFAKCGELHYATISTKKDPKNPGNKLSMGFGFVRYKFKSDADKALKTLQMTSLDGKTLELKRSERTLQSDVKASRKTTKITEQTGTKILVRNIPFQANADEIRDLFKALGEIKSVRLPKKLVGDEKHRGFGFVEFYTKKEAKTAFKALCQSTHLYGRRLVLEWAQKEENIEDLRKRTARHFHDGPSSKKSKKGTLDPDSIGLQEE